MSNQSLDHLTALLEEDRASVWTLEEAVELCRYLEAIAPDFGCHVALTGGCLYKDGRRKDADIMFYRIRQKPVIDQAGLLDALKRIHGIEVVASHGWVIKVTYDGKPVDLFFPEDITKDIDGKCLDGQYPDGPTCPACNGPRTKINSRWVHGVPPICNACYQNKDSDLLRINPANGCKVCNYCNQDLYMSITNDYWWHPPGKGFALTNAITVVCDMNPNFMGLDALKATGAAIISPGLPVPPPTNLPPILQTGIDISVNRNVQSTHSEKDEYR
jgi:hypothetical protein